MRAGPRQTRVDYRSRVLLSDRDIKSQIDSGRVVLDPYEPSMIQPSSIDVRLDKFFRLFDNHKYPFIDPAAEQPELTRLVEVDASEPFILHPGEFVLGSTYEQITLPDDVAARVEGKSSLGRLGLLTHAPLAARIKELTGFTLDAEHGALLGRCAQCSKEPQPTSRPGEAEQE